MYAKQVVKVRVVVCSTVSQAERARGGRQSDARVNDWLLAVVVVGVLRAPARLLNSAEVLADWSLTATVAGACGRQ